LDTTKLANRKKKPWFDTTRNRREERLERHVPRSELCPSDELGRLGVIDHPARNKRVFEGA
jgi:hypothetical protein